MFSKLLSVRFIAVILAALLMVAGLQASASAATARSLSIVATPAVAAVGTSVTFSGKLSRSPKGSTVLIQRKSGRRWVKAGSTRTVTAAGSYLVRIARPTSVATYSYRAYVAAKGSLKAATSRTVSVAALTRTYASLSATPASTTAGSTTTLAGTVFPFVKGTVVTLQKRIGSNWTSVVSTTVAANGTFSKGIVPATSTVYRASVARAGSNAPVISNERNVVAKPLITSPSLPAATRLSPYTASLTTYANQAGTWTAVPLPTGLTLNAATGVIYGTPNQTVPGDTNVVIGFTQLGTGLVAASKTLTLRVNQATAPRISTNTLPSGTRLAAYTTTLTATNNPPGTWTAAPLPSGLSLNPSTGVISGIPDTVQTKQVVIGFTQTNTGLAATPKTIALAINNAPAPVITTSSLPTGTNASQYSTTLLAQGNPAGTWTATPLPAGLSVAAATGVISGTPTAPGDTQVVIGFTRTSDGIAANPITLLLQINNAPAPVITTSSLPTGTKASFYSTSLVAQGNPTGTWTASPLPNGLSLDAATGVISGTPTATGDTQVVIGFTRTSDGIAANPVTLLLQIDPGANPVITTASLPSGTRLSPYNSTLTAAGNPAGTWTASPLPNGLSLNAATGVISGTPTTVGDTDVVIGFTQTNTGSAATPKTLTLHINEAAAPVIGTASLPDGTRLAVYSTTLTATGNPAGTWTASPLPTGLSLNAATGVISGTPTTVGDTNVVIGFTQTSTGVAATPKTLTLHINEAAAPVIGTANLPDGTRLSSYSTTLTATGNPAGTWTASPLPNGLSLDATTGIISGTPTTVGDTNVVIGFTQTSTGLAATPKTLTLHIAEAAPPVISTSSLPDGLRYHPYTTTLGATGNPAGTWTASPLPNGMTLNATTGVISGTPPNAGDTSVVIGFTQTSTGLAATPKTLVLHVLQSNPVITSPSTLPNTTPLASYTYQLTVAPAPVGTWTLFSGSPPLGISILKDGKVSGSTVVPGTYTFTVRFTETSTGLSTNMTLSLSVD
jgi:hypothetical protein